ncbi:MAG: hypothetical protein M8364_21070 [Methylobacter sp.]|nr:hypothetical protein [Methylobacter sp.]MCL7423386.1 hypothetical protein [Methylobacter sp.]
MTIIKIKGRRTGQKLLVASLLMLGTGQAFADDGELVRKSMSKGSGNPPV